MARSDISDNRARYCFPICHKRVAHAAWTWAFPSRSKVKWSSNVARASPASTAATISFAYPRPNAAANAANATPVINSASAAILAGLALATLLLHLTFDLEGNAQVH